MTPRQDIPVRSHHLSDLLDGQRLKVNSLTVTNYPDSIPRGAECQAWTSSNLFKRDGCHHSTAVALKSGFISYLLVSDLENPVPNRSVDR